MFINCVLIFLPHSFLLFLHYISFFNCCSSTVVSIFSPHSHSPTNPYLPPSNLPPFGFVHGSFICVPWWAFLFFPISSFTPDSFPFLLFLLPLPCTNKDITEFLRIFNIQEGRTHQLALIGQFNDHNFLFSWNVYLSFKIEISPTAWEKWLFRFSYQQHQLDGQNCTCVITIEIFRVCCSHPREAGWVPKLVWMLRLKLPHIHQENKKTFSAENVQIWLVRMEGWLARVFMVIEGTSGLIFLTCTCVFGTSHWCRRTEHPIFLIRFPRYNRKEERWGLKAVSRWHIKNRTRICITSDKVDSKRLLKWKKL